MKKAGVSALYDHRLAAPTSQTVAIDLLSLPSKTIARPSNPHSVSPLNWHQPLGQGHVGLLLLEGAGATTASPRRLTDAAAEALSRTEVGTLER